MWAWRIWRWSWLLDEREARLTSRVLRCYVGVAICVSMGVVDQNVRNDTVTLVRPVLKNRKTDTIERSSAGRITRTPHAHAAALTASRGHRLRPPRCIYCIAALELSTHTVHARHHSAYIAHTCMYVYTYMESRSSALDQKPYRCRPDPCSFIHTAPPTHAANLVDFERHLSTSLCAHHETMQQPPSFSSKTVKSRSAVAAMSEPLVAVVTPCGKAMK